MFILKLIVGALLLVGVVWLARTLSKPRQALPPVTGGGQQGGEPVDDGRAPLEQQE